MFISQSPVHVVCAPWCYNQPRRLKVGPWAASHNRPGVSTTASLDRRHEVLIGQSFVAIIAPPLAHIENHERRHDDTEQDAGDRQTSGESSRQLLHVQHGRLIFKKKKGFFFKMRWDEIETRWDEIRRKIKWYKIKLSLKITLKRLHDRNLSLPQNYWPYVRGIHRSSVDSPHRGSEMQHFDAFFVVIMVRPLNQQSNCRWFETMWRYCTGSGCFENFGWTVSDKTFFKMATSFFQCWNGDTYLYLWDFSAPRRPAEIRHGPSSLSRPELPSSPFLL